MSFKRVTLFILLFFLFVIAVTYCFKSSILNYLVSEKVERFQGRYGVTFSFHGLKLQGIRTITISDVTAKLPNDSMLLKAHNISVKLAIPELLRMKVNPLFLGFDSLSINLYPKVYSRFVPAEKIDSAIQVVTSSKIKTFNVRFASRAIRTIMGISTSEINFKNFKLNYFNTNNLTTISSPSIKSLKGDFFARFEVIEDSNQSFFHLWGNSSKADNRFFLKVLGDDTQPFHLPIAHAMFDLDLRFDSLSFSFYGNNLSSDTLHFSGFSKVKGLKVYHPKLSESEVVIDSGSINFSVGMNQEVAKMDSTTAVTFNKFKLPFQLQIENRKYPKVLFSASTGIIGASNLFESLPKGLFFTLQGIRVQGDINLEIKTEIDFALPDSLSFFAKLTPYNFRLLSFGNVDFSKINDTLIYTVYVNDSTNKYIHLTSDNKYFRPSERISPHIINAVITAEDGGFYGHKGFDPEGFRYALAQNIKQKRMARGGSTITMQLVKNLYLNHSKNLVRKAEEALIVWLIETQRIVEKDRMLEIYLNIIEWGPCINGIAEATEFYFEKEPHEIELNEAIFLASIVPKPNYFMYNFDDDFNLKPFMADYYRFVARKMHDRGAITDEELENLIPNVELKGKALEYIRKRLHDNPIDTLNTFIEEDDF